jgi:hypothetical protein
MHRQPPVSTPVLLGSSGSSSTAPSSLRVSSSSGPSSSSSASSSSWSPSTPAPVPAPASAAAASATAANPSATSTPSLVVASSAPLGGGPDGDQRVFQVAAVKTRRWRGKLQRILQVSRHGVSTLNAKDMVVTNEVPLAAVSLSPDALDETLLTVSSAQTGPMKFQTHQRAFFLARAAELMRHARRDTPAASFVARGFVFCSPTDGLVPCVVEVSTTFLLVHTTSPRVTSVLVLLEHICRAHVVVGVDELTANELTATVASSSSSCSSSAASTPAPNPPPPPPPLPPPPLPPPVAADTRGILIKRLDGLPLVIVVPSHDTFVQVIFRRAAAIGNNIRMAPQFRRADVLAAFEVRPSALRFSSRWICCSCCFETVATKLCHSV